MNTDNFVVSYLLTSLVAGLLGVMVLEFVMWLTSRGGPAHGSMVLALGGLLTRSRARAFRVGAMVHGIAGVGFALIYVWVMGSLGYTHFPRVLEVGLGLGLVHGLLVSLALVWVVADHHPLEEFKEADLAIGLSHFVGHVAYGAAVALVVGLSPL